MKKGIFFFFVSLYLLGAPGHFNATDGVGVFMTTRNIVEQGSLGQDDYSFEAGYLPIYFQGKDGRWYGKYGIGQSLLSIPLYMAAIVAGRALPHNWRNFFAGYDYNYWGGTLPIFFVSTFCQLITPLLLVISYAFCRKMGFTAVRSLTLVFLLGLGSLFWSNSRDYFQHPLEALLLLGSIYVLFDREDLSPSHFLLSGLILGFAVMSRPVHVINIVPMAPYALWRGFRQKTPGGKTIRNFIAFMGPVLAGILIQLSVNFHRFGGFLSFGGYGAGNEFLLGNILSGLYVYTVSLGHGVFIFAPPAILGVTCYRLMWRHRRAETVLFATIVIINLCFYACMPNKHDTDFGVYGIWCYGPRYILLTIPFMLLPLGYFRPRLKTGGVPIWLAGLAGAASQVPGVLVSYAFVLNAIRGEFSMLGAEANAVDHITLYHPQYCLLSQSTKYLMKGEFIDLWMVNGYRLAGFKPFVFCLVFLVATAVFGIYLMRSNLRTDDAVDA